MVARVQIVGGAEAIAGVKVHLLVDTGVAQKVEKDLLRHTRRAEVLHLCATSKTRHMRTHYEDLRSGRGAHAIGKSLVGLDSKMADGKRLATTRTSGEEAVSGEQQLRRRLDLWLAFGHLEERELIGGAARLHRDLQRGQRTLHLPVHCEGMRETDGG